MDGSSIDVGNIILKSQKKLLSTFANRKTLGPILDDDAKKLLTSAHHLLKEAFGKKEAQKLTSGWIKILVKITFLVKSDSLNGDELKMLDEVQSEFGTIVKIILSFWEIEFTFEVNHLQEKLKKMENLLTTIVNRNMTDKNKSKLKMLFNFVSQDEFLTNIFTCDKTSKLGLAMIEFTTNLKFLANNNKF